MVGCPSHSGFGVAGCAAGVEQGLAGRGDQIPAVHGSYVRFDSVNGKIGPRRVGGTTKRTPSAKVSAVFRDLPAACGRFEPANRLFPRFGASSTQSLAFAPRNEPPRGRAPSAQTIWIRLGSSLAFQRMPRDT
eukprot:gene4824-biopygen10075